MDAQLPARIVETLVPFLPFLLKGLELAGQETAKTIGKKVAEKGFERVRALWDKLRRKHDIEQVAQKVAAAPDDQELRKALQEAIARTLAEDPALREEIATIFSHVKVGDVKPSGEVTGVKATLKSPKDIHSTVEAGDVSGRVTGVEVHGE